MLQQDTSSLLERAKHSLAQSGIELCVTKKRVKNINFRLKPYQLMVSAPISTSTLHIAQAVAKRVPWALANHAQVVAQYDSKPSLFPKSLEADRSILLWGVPQPCALSQADSITYYRQHLSDVVPSLFKKWQPVVGATAREIRLKKMHTRWGSCNTRARRIWLSVYLPAYPIRCTEYVIVHELCHLHHPNHSRAFWQTVETAMPDYRHWHDMLAGKLGRLD